LNAKFAVLILQTALHLAVIANQPELVRCLVAYGANINCRDRDGKYRNTL